MSNMTGESDSNTLQLLLSPALQLLTDLSFINEEM